MQDAACGVRVPGILAGANDTGQFLLAKSPAWWAQRIAWYPDGCFGPYRSAQEGYSRRELAVDGIVHLVGVLMGCVGAVLMLVRISDPACPAVVRAGLGVYACSLLAMLCCSAAFNLLVARWTTSTKALQLADHAGILLLIAGSYTPLMVVLCCGRTLAFVWTAGVVGPHFGIGSNPTTPTLTLSRSPSTNPDLGRSRSRSPNLSPNPEHSPKAPTLRPTPGELCRQGLRLSPRPPRAARPLLPLHGLGVRRLLGRRQRRRTVDMT